MSRKAAEKATTHGGERKGAGRPSMGRTSQPPKIKPEAMSLLREIAAFRKGTVAEAIELAATVAMDALEGRPVKPELMRYQ